MNDQHKPHSSPLPVTLNWPLAVAISICALAFALAIWGMTSGDGDRYRAELENNKARIEYDKWLMEKGFIKEPRLR